MFIEHTFVCSYVCMYVLYVCLVHGFDDCCYLLTPSLASVPLKCNVILYSWYGMWCVGPVVTCVDNVVYGGTEMH